MKQCEVSRSSPFLSHVSSSFIEMVCIIHTLEFGGAENHMSIWGTFREKKRVRNGKEIFQVTLLPRCDFFSKGQRMSVFHDLRKYEAPWHFPSVLVEIML